MDFFNGILTSINNAVVFVNNYLWSYILIIMLVVIGIYFTIKTNFSYNSDIL